MKRISSEAARQATVNKVGWTLEAPRLVTVDQVSGSILAAATGDGATTTLDGGQQLKIQTVLNAGLLIADTPLSPTTRRIVHKLLTGMTEKEIAAAMHQTVPTTHKYVTTIYERFGVKSRAHLMALWLGQ